jgi:hypothetical protein
MYNPSVTIIAPPGRANSPRVAAVYLGAKLALFTYLIASVYGPHTFPVDKVVR